MNDLSEEMTNSSEGDEDHEGFLGAGLKPALFQSSVPFLSFVISFENTCEGITCTEPPGFRNTREIGSQANSTQNKPGFPRMRE